MGREVDKLLAQLREDNSLKVWSLIITFFGDAIVARGGNVSAKTVQAVLSGMNVGGGAVRTAFSRLVSDQWIVRSKIGRESFYELADDGYRPFKVASSRIYSVQSADDTNDWTLVIKDGGSKAISSHRLDAGVQLSANCWLFKRIENKVVDALIENDCLVLSGELICEELPDWILGKLIPDNLRDGYFQLQKRFSIIKQAGKLSPLDSLVVRCLLIHQWRRLLLRSPALPGALLPAEQECRRFVAEFYHQLLPGSETWLDEEATCANGRIPAATDDIRLRFTEQFIQQ